MKINGWTVTEHRWLVTWGGATSPLETQWKSRTKARRFKAMLSKETGPRMFHEIVARREA